MAFIVLVFIGLCLTGFFLLLYLWIRVFNMGRIVSVSDLEILTANCGRFHVRGNQEDDQVIHWRDLQWDKMRSETLTRQVLFPPDAFRNRNASLSLDRFTLVRGEGESMHECGINSGDLLWVEMDNGATSGVQYQTGDIVLIANRHEAQKEIKIRGLLKPIPPGLVAGIENWWFTGCGGKDKELVEVLYRALRGGVSIDTVKNLLKGEREPSEVEVMDLYKLSEKMLANTTVGIHWRWRFVAKYHAQTARIHRQCLVGM